MMIQSRYEGEPTESVVFEGSLGEVVALDFDDGRHFERYRRPPGTRLIIVSPKRQILVTREHRLETKGVDLRLPGGKVCDSLEEYHALLASGVDMREAAKAGAIKEGLEETGLIIRNPQLLTVANAGASVEWDLYYYMADDFSYSPDGQQLEQGENIETSWMQPAALRRAIAANQMSEWRTVGVLLGLVLPELEV